MALLWALTEVSTLCGLALDIEAEFLVDNGKSVSTSSLNGLAGRWFSALPPDRFGDEVLMERILAISRYICLLLVEELTEDNYSGSTIQRMYEYTPEECRILHSIDILARTLGLHLLLHVYSPGFSASDDKAWSQNRITRSIVWMGRAVEGMDQLSDIVFDDLQERGWCVSELYLMAAHELIIASLLERPRARNHPTCTDTLCHAYQTDEETYKTVHVDETCSCDFVSVPMEDLVNVLAQDQVPAVLVTTELEVCVVHTERYPYIALSHVCEHWFMFLLFDNRSLMTTGADGLGNPRDNALPRCQLRRLRDFANDLYDSQFRTLSTAGKQDILAEGYVPSEPSSTPVALWMDTLCIPVHPTAKTSRKKAIQLLGRTFHEARAVLVLDRELEMIPSATASFLELGIRMLCSGWMKRLWTLQEATLASEALGEDRIFFQMQDGPFLYQKYDRNRTASTSLDGLTTELQVEERDLLDEHGVMILLGEQIPSVRAMRDMREGWSPFHVIFAAIEHRSTSKVEDIPLCMASLLGKDVSFVLSGDSAEQRMANFYMLMREVPAGILWVEKAKKLSMAPFRWAPISIAECPMMTFMGWHDVICDVAGLHVQYPGFILKEIAAQESYSMLPENFDLLADTGEVLGRLSSGRAASTRNSISLRPDLSLAVITSPPRLELSPNAAIVELDRKGGRDDMLVCTVVGYMFFSRTDKRSQTTVIRCDPTPMDQMWCIT